MNFFGLLNRPTNLSAEAGEIIAFYNRLRPVRTRLNNELVGRLPRDVLDEGGARLGILRRGKFVFDSEDELAVLTDYCIYDVSRRGRNAIDDYLRNCPPAADSDEMTCLQTMQKAAYALVVVTSVERGVGCGIKDFWTDETWLLVDFGLSRTARPGMMLATRLLDFGAFVTTTGAALPLGILSDDEELASCRGMLSNAHHDQLEDPAPLIRLCLDQGASSHVRYEESAASAASDHQESLASARPPGPKRRTPATRRSGKPAENRRCRCGSGKMIKNCCGKVARHQRKAK